MPGAAQAALAINANHLALKAIYRVSTLGVTELVTNKIVGDTLPVPEARAHNSISSLQRTSATPQEFDKLFQIREYS